ncbi:WD40/YVTN/BNR-like repeat-containing protein [Emcibacter sp.]|uniref:WD40/YVTN/BNR-like repeat-containing protein n=1 Tax=Emcibacter sp. TaxID=1979954 RepID=UPI002AA738F6|nr:YCF48-related protein [Emcibacter sp.]
MNHRIWETRSLSGAVILLFLAVLGGCEARLDLSGVEATEEQAVKRYDQFLAGAENDQITVIVGRRGVILTSADRGQNWKRQSVIAEGQVGSPTFVDVDTCPDGHFIALDADRRVWRSGADASTWTYGDIETSEDVVDLACDPDGNYWIVGSFTLILKSEDQGKTWQDLSIGEDALLSRIQFLSAGHAVITGEFGVVYVSADGGNSWSPTGPVPNEFYSAASYFRSENEGWVGGLQGIILHTEDGGQTWVRQPSGTSSPIYNIFETGQALYALGDQGTLLKFDGEHWRSLDVAGLGFGYLRAAVAAGEDQIIVAGGNGLLRRLH